VSNALSKLNVDSTALGFVGGKSGEFPVAKLESLGVAHDLIWIERESRINPTILQQDFKKHLKVNEPWPTIQKGAQKRLLEKVGSLAEKGDWFINPGSLPPGIHDNYYAQLIQGVQTKGAKAVLDTSDRALV